MHEIAITPGSRERTDLDILDSLEVRWFFAGDHLAAAAACASFASVTVEGRRVDHYLVTDRNDLGLKARLVEGETTKVETKYLVRGMGTIRLGERIAGNLERWRKLSLAVDDRQGLRRQGLWLAVEKDRRLRKFAFENGYATEVSATSRPDAGCGFELTQVRYRLDDELSVPEWTLGLEAFGPEPKLLEILQATSRVAFIDDARFELDGARSASYPEWLLCLGEKQGRGQEDLHGLER